MEIHKQNAEPWKVTLVDTGEATLTGGRLARVSDYLNDTFCFTYGDGVADVDIQALVQPPGRYGAIGLDGYQVQQCQEKPDGDGGWINGGYFVLEPLYQALLEQGVLEHVPTTPATPKHLGFEAQRALAERLGDGYDLYGYLEDDLIVQDPLFFHKIFWFQQHMGSDAVLLPHRMELFWQPDRLLEKLYIDGAVPEADLKALLIHTAEPMAAPLPGGNIVFAPPANPHSGCFFLTHGQLQHWSEQPWFLDGDSSYVSPLESAATLGICKTFRIYKPHLAYAAFLELQHWGTSFRNLIGNGVTPPDPVATSG